MTDTAKSDAPTSPQPEEETEETNQQRYHRESNTPPYCCTPGGYNCITEDLIRKLRNERKSIRTERDIQETLRELNGLPQMKESGF